jgi:hypothetical protein
MCCSCAIASALLLFQLVRRFAKARSPGIYKDDYIQALYAYYHEERPDFGPDAVETPLVPAWKPDGSSPEHFGQPDAAQDIPSTGADFPAS